MSEQERQSSAATVNTRCPHCREIVTVAFRAFLEGVAVTNVSPETYREGLPPVDRLMLESADKSGVLIGFRDAYSRLNQIADKKVNFDRAFLAWLKRAAQAKLPSDELAAIASLYGGRIEVYQLNSLAGVVANGYLKGFVPYMSLKTKAARMPLERQQILGEWLRSKHGYIVGKGAFFQAMRAARTTADFARMVQ